MLRCNESSNPPDYQYEIGFQLDPNNRFINFISYTFTFLKPSAAFSGVAEFM